MMIYSETKLQFNDRAVRKEVKQVVEAIDRNVSVSRAEGMRMSAVIKRVFFFLPSTN